MFLCSPTDMYCGALAMRKRAGLEGGRLGKRRNVDEVVLGWSSWGWEHPRKTPM